LKKKSAELRVLSAEGRLVGSWQLAVGSEDFKESAEKDSAEKDSAEKDSAEC
jgi:hypothetical protein